MTSPICGDAWIASDLETVSNPEDLDARVEALLDSRECREPGAAAMLAVLLGVDAWVLDRLAGVPVANDVAAARLRLIGAALAEVVARAEALRRGDDARGLRQALAVCAALQWEALGEVGLSEAAFALRDGHGFDGVLLAAAVREAVPRGRRAVLARVRAIAVAEAPAQVAAAIAC